MAVSKLTAAVIGTGYTGKRTGVGRLGGRYTIEGMSQDKNATVGTGDLGPGGR